MLEKAPDGDEVYDSMMRNLEPFYIDRFTEELREFGIA